MHLVTGGSGYLGSRLAARLHARGERVRILDTWDAPDRPAPIEFHRGDIRNPDQVSEAMRGVEVVHHCVSLVPLTKSRRGFFEVNRDGTGVALECARRADVRMFVHVSSSAVYGTAASPITEATPLHPVEAYGRAKLAAEERVTEAAAAGLPCAIVRPRTILGPGRLGIFEILFDWISDGRAIYVIGSGRVPFQFVHVDDVADACLRCADTGRTGVFNVGADRFGSLREDLGALIAHAGTGSRIRSLPTTLAVGALATLDAFGLSPLAPWHYLTYHRPFWFDISHARAALGWSPLHGNQEMLIESYEWFLRNRVGPGTGPGSPHRSGVRRGVLALLKRLS